MKLKLVDFCIILLFHCKFIAANEKDEGQCTNIVKNKADNDLKLLYIEAKSPDFDARKSAAERLTILIKNGDISIKIIIKSGFIKIFVNFLESKNKPLREHGLNGLNFVIKSRRIKALYKAGALSALVKYLGKKENEAKVIHMLTTILNYYFLEYNPVVIKYGIIESIENVVKNEELPLETAEKIPDLLNFLMNDTEQLTEEQNLKIYSIFSKLFENKNNKNLGHVASIVFFHAVIDLPQIKLIEKSGLMKKIFPHIKYFTKHYRLKVFTSLRILSYQSETIAQILIDNGILKYIKPFLNDNEVNEDLLLIINYFIRYNVKQFEAIRDENIIEMVVKFFKHEKEEIRIRSAKIMAHLVLNAHYTLIFSLINDVSPFCDLLTSIKNNDEAIIEIFHALNEMFKTFSTYDKRLRSAIVNEKCWDNIKLHEDSDNEQISDLATEIIDKYYNLLEFDKEIGEVEFIPIK